jgi:hypothetical protein
MKRTYTENHRGVSGPRIETRRVVSGLTGEIWYDEKTISTR